MFYPVRVAQFMVLGYTSFGRKTFETKARTFNPDSIPEDLGGRHIVVTGGTSGIGKVAVEELAARNATVHLVCRNSKGGEKVRDDILSEHSNASVHVHTCDLSSLSDIARLASEFQKSDIRIRALVNNAGAMLQSHEKSADGLEANFATNTLGTFAITEMLRPSLDVENGARVITVSSGGMLTEALDIDDLEGAQLLKDGGEKINGERQYAKCKRHQVAITEHWARKYSEQGIFWATMHPGWVDTPGVSPVNFFFFQRLLVHVHGRVIDCNA